ncbi:DUF998 domain-containing protein [Actinokineospora sp.]|uniref:DUF998 domain-containing protein n=1 Tax=Actinokineospora sp. TaxID=1872133 RepID=UPI003D6B20A7
MTQTVRRDLVHSYLYLRRAIGLIGLALPPVLILGKILLDGGGLQNSLSGYYYTGMRDVLVGAMWAVGVFLFCYRGYSVVDDWVANIAGISAIGVAIFPTSPSGGPNVSAADDKLLGYVHVAAAAVFFLSLAYFCLFLFTRQDGENPGEHSEARNKVYVACGVAIVVCIGLIPVIAYLFDNETKALHPALWLESGAVLAFGVAWATKGKAIAILKR